MDHLQAQSLITAIRAVRNEPQCRHWDPMG